MSKHLAFVSVPAYGHVNPTLPLVEELVARGHRVSYATGSELLPAVREAGATPVELPWDFDVSKIVGRGFGADGSRAAAMMTKLIESSRVCLPVLVEHFGDDRPDAVCHDGMSFVGSALADKIDVPAVALIPSFASNKHFDLRSKMRGSAGADAASAVLAEVQAALKAFAADNGLSERFAVFGQEPTAGLKVAFIPRSFQFAGETFDDTFRFIGPSLGSRAHSDEWSPPADGSPVLFISLGTVFNDRPEFFAMCVEAFGGSPWHVVMSIGAAVDPASLGAIPSNFEVGSRFPQPAVLGHARAFVSHTGMNSTMEALYQAVPLIAVPQMGEQVLNAERAEELGCGRKLDPETLTADLLRDTVSQVADDETIRANLARVSRELRACGGATEGAEAIEAYLGELTATSNTVSRPSSSSH
ncbi:MAG: glycosyl transferase [Kutzneria sp.]|nr:glycosyl transferase [Kutzneria sp.]MBV9846941.1 glycosyl transferase [Kutzneria sp.]